MYFTKDNGVLKAWAYKWQDDNPRGENFTGKIISYSFQDNMAWEMVYNSDKLQTSAKQLVVEGNHIKTTTATKQTHDAADIGTFFRKILCWMAGGTWSDGSGDNGNYGAHGEVGVAGCDYDSESVLPGGIGMLPAGVVVTIGEPMNGSSTVVGTTPTYGGGTVWVHEYKPGVAGPGCGINTGGTGGEYLDPGTDGSGSGCEPVEGYWEGVVVPIETITSNLISGLGITNANKIAYLNNNPNVTKELHIYLVNNGFSQDNRDFINWAVDYLMANPSTDFTHFTKQFLTSFYPSTFRTISDNETAINPETGQTITFGEIKAIFENTPGLIEAIESGNEPPPGTAYSAILLSFEYQNERDALSKQHPDWSHLRVVSTALWNVIREEFHFMLDVAGMFPVVGEAADLINGGIYYLEGDYINCAWSVSSAVPITGWVSTGGKWIKRARNAIHVSSIPAGAKAFRAIKNVKGAVRLVKLPVSTFAHSAINTLQAIKPADNTLTNISATLVDQFSHRVKPVIQSLKNKIDDIVLHADATGVKTEELADELFETNGFIKHEGRFGSNNGFDGIYIKKDASGNVQEIIINEAKQIGSAGNIKLGTTTSKGPQMSERWIEGTITEMRDSGNIAIAALGDLLYNNSSKITKTVSAVDKSTAEIVILKLSNYR